MSKQEDAVAAKIRGLEDRVTVLEGKAGVFASPTGAEVLAAKNAAKAARLAAEAKAQAAADAAARAVKKPASKAGGARLEILTAMALVMVTGMLALAGNLWKLSDKTYVTDTDTMVVSNLTVTGTAGITGTTTLGTLSPTLISNATMKVYGSNLVIKAGGTVEIPDASLASADLPATLTDTTLISNQVLKVYGSNLVVKAGGTVSVPAGSISEASIATLGITTSLNVIVAGNTTNTLVFTNGLLKSSTAL